MKIVHLVLNGILTDNYSYQENLLTKYHKKLGFDVTIITNEYIYNNGKLTKDKRTNYINEDGIHVIRLKIKNDRPFDYKFKRYEDLIDRIEEEKPDILFIHGVSFVDIKNVSLFLKKNSGIIAFLDNHCDSSNSGTNLLSYYILHKIIWRYYAKKISPYIKKFYGVMPSRVDWLINVYKLPRNKCELLLMGVDDDLANKVRKDKFVAETRKQLGISLNDFVIITGGKIDSEKKQIITLEKVIKNIKNPKIKLIIFGSLDEDIKKEVLSYCCDRIIYVGWKNHEEIYKLIICSNLAVYPGRHSVLWEETVGLGIPLIVKKWPGTQHINVNGNAQFIDNDSVESLCKLIRFSMNDKNYKILKHRAKIAAKCFSYYEIAKKSIEI